MIITAPKLITVQDGSQPIENGAVALDRDRILDAGPDAIIAKKYPGHRLVSLAKAVLMPGLVNVHTHLELPELLERTRAGTFPEWVLNLVNAKKSLKKNDYRTASEGNIQALIRYGTTTTGEICTHGISPAFLKESGLRAVVFREIIGMNRILRHRRLPLRLLVFQYILMLRNHALLFTRRGKGLIRNGLSPHAPYTVSKELLARIQQRSRKRNMPLAMHVAESRDEIRLLRREHSGLEKLYALAGWDRDRAPSAVSPFKYLKDLDLLDPNFLAVHAVQATESDIDLLKRSGAAVAHCPRSNRETGVGAMPLRKFMDAGITVGLGTDSLASSPSLNLWDEMRYAFAIHGNDGITARDILGMATAGGAKALGMERETGTLEPGKKADIIAVPIPERDAGDLYSDLLRETESCIMSMVNGKILFKNTDTLRDSSRSLA